MLKEVVCEDIGGVTHPGFESDEFENHFHSEDSSEDHIKNVHYIVEERWLAIVLQNRDREGQLRETEENRAAIISIYVLYYYYYYHF